MAIKSWFTLNLDNVLINLPLIKRSLDNIYVNYKWKSLNYKFFDKVYFENVIFWTLDLNRWKIFYYLNLDTLDEKEIYCDDFKIVNYKYQNTNYTIIVYVKQNYIKYFLNKNLPNELELVINFDKIVIKNTIFWTILFEEKNDFKTYKVDNQDLEKELEIFTIYSFNSLFFDTKIENNFIESYDNFKIKVNNFKTDFYHIQKVDISKKLLLNDLKIYFNNWSFIDKDSSFLKDFQKVMKFKNQYLTKIESLDKFKTFIPEKLTLKEIDSVENFDNIDISKFNVELISSSIISFQNNIRNLQLLLFYLENTENKISNLDISFKKADITARLLIMQENINIIKTKLKLLINEVLSKSI